MTFSNYYLGLQRRILNYYAELFVHVILGICKTTTNADEVVVFVEEWGAAEKITVFLDALAGYVNW